MTATLQSSDLNFANGAKAGNYIFNTSVVGTGHITPAPLTVTINGNPTRTYDGTGDTSAPLSPGNYTLSGVIPGESITVNGSATGNYYDTSNGAAPGPASYEGNAGVWGVVAALSSGNFTANGNTLLSNYSLPTQALGFGTITKANAGIYLVTDVNGSKVYDGTNTLIIAPGSSTNYLVLGGLQGGDQATLTSSVTGTFASKNVGSQPLTVADLIASDFTFTSGSASNYTFPETVTGTGIITPAPLVVSIVGNPTKTYDGNTTVLPLTSGNFQITGFVSGEGATINPTASFTYATANAGTSGSDAITGSLTQNNYVAGSGTLLSNYTLDYVPTGFGTINRANLYVTGIYGQNKVYDTTDDATVNIVNGQLAGLADVDKNNSAITLIIGNATTSSGANAAQGSIAGSGVVTGSAVAGTFASADAGNNQAVSTLFSLGGTSANNYNLVQPVLVANITPAPLTISGIIANNKVYDGTTTATFGANNSFTFDTQNATLSGFVGADNANDVTLSATGATGTFSTANVGNNLSVTGVGGFFLGAGTAGDKSGDYYVVQPTGLTAAITPRPLSVTITGNPTKVYDGSTSATLTAGDYTIGAVAGDPNSGWVSGQGATLPQSATASYASANVNGVNGSVVNSTLVSSDWKVDNASTLLSNYILPTTATGTGTITPYALNLSGTRVYDTTTVALGNLFGTITGLNGDTFTLSGQGSTNSKNIGTYTGTGSSTNTQAFNLNTLSLTAAGATGSGPDLASNYTLIGGADSFVITPAVLTITGTTVNSKVYNGSTAATLGGTQQLVGVLGGDSVSVSGETGNFVSPNAGSNIAVNADITIGGSDAGNYILTQPTGLTGTITQALITLNGTRPYDATTAANASAFGNNGVISTGVNGETLTVTGAGLIAAPDVNTYTQTGGTFNIGSLALGNATGLASNYTLGTSNTFAVTPYVINLSGTRVYDTTMTADASLFGTGGLIAGVNGQTLTLTGSGSVSSKNVGTYQGTGASSGSQPFNLGTLSLVTDTGNANNYTLIGGKDTLSITPAPLTITGTTVDPKTYDGTTTATLGGTQQLVGVLGSDNVSISADVGTFASPNAGSNIPVSAAIVLGGGDAGNYQLTQPTGLTGDISKAIINLSGTRQYDGTVDAQSTAFGNNGVIDTGVNGETLTLGGAGTTTGANVGSYGGANFSLGTLALGNGSGSASNYTLIGGTDTFVITQHVLNLTGVRVYDTTTGADASLFGSGGLLLGVNGELLALSGSGVLSTKNAGQQQAFAVNGLSGFTLTGVGAALGSNYTLAGGTDWVTITPYVLGLSGSRAYDGTTSANAALFGVGGVLTGLNGETLVLSGSGTVGSANANATYTGVGSTTPGQAFDLHTLQLGNGTGLAGNYTLVGGNDALTISRAVIDLSGTRMYDGGAVAAASAFGNNGVINTGVNGETLTLTGAGAVTSANVGTYTGGNFIAGTMALANGTGSASNYTLVGGTDSLAITPYVLNLSGSRAYDGTTGAAASLFGSNGVLVGVNGETLTLSGTGNLSSANANTNPYTGIGSSTPGQGFNLNTLSLTGNGAALASNYTLIGGADQLTITPYVLSLIGSRAYDGTTGAMAALFGNGGVLTGVNGETLVLSGSGTVGSANANATYTGIGSTTPGQAFDLHTLQLSNGTGLAGNYTLVGGNDALTINRAVINLNGTRQYDGGNDVSAGVFGNNGVISTGVNGETLDVTGAGTVASANVGNYSGGNFNSGTLALADGSGAASNYTLAGGTMAITPYVLNLGGSRAYDGTTGAAAALFGNNGVLTGVNGETLTLSGAGIVSSANASGTPYTGIGSAAPGQNFDLSTLSLTGNGAALASNYTLIGGNDALTINRAVITISGTREYDGGVDAAAGIFGSNGVISTGVNGETITLTGTGTVAGANVGNYTGGNFSATGLGLIDGSGLASNYTIGGGSVSITPYVIDLSGARAYDGTTGAAAALFGNNGVLTGVNGETLVLSGSGTVASANANVTPYTGIGSGTNGQGFDLRSLQLGNGTGLASNYTLIGGADSLTINKAAIDLSGTRTYDGGTDANASVFGNNGVISTGVNGETLNLTGAGTVTGANVGSYGGGNFNDGTLALADGSGAASNYTLAGGTLAITPYVLDLTGTRVYDATTGAHASLFGNGGVLTGVNGETITLGGSGVLSTKNVGQQLAFAGNGLDGFTLTGNGAALGSNYTLVGGTDWVTITPLAITVSATGQNKVYDGNTVAGVTLGSNGVLGGDTVIFNDGGADFSSPNAGNHVSIAVSGITASGADAGNYSFNTTASTSADISPYVLSLTGTRVYDGSTGASAALFGNNGVLTGINGETVTLSGSGVLTGKDVATQIAFANTGSLVLSNGSGLASNYTLVGGTDWVSITPLSIVVTATGTDRMYNGRVDDGVTLTSSGVLPGDQLSFSDTSASFSDPYVGNGKTVTVSGITASGANAADYVIVDPVTTTLADITSAGFDGTGVQGSWIAELQGGLQPSAIATPYGSSDSDTTGVYTGNHQLKHQPVVRNRARSDFRSGLSLQLQNGGVRLPADASP
jgi:hypothetical protein